MAALASPRKPHGCRELSVESDLGRPCRYLADQQMIAIKQFAQLLGSLYSRTGRKPQRQPFDRLGADYSHDCFFLIPSDIDLQLSRVANHRPNCPWVPNQAKGCRRGMTASRKRYL